MELTAEEIKILEELEKRGGEKITNEILPFGINQRTNYETNEIDIIKNMEGKINL